MNTRCPPFSHCRLTGATTSEDNAALGSLQASSEAPGQTTGVAGARNTMLVNAATALREGYTDTHDYAPNKVTELYQNCC
ncbi:UNVERIFIED_CONTAM: hypothetical protein FKN15_001906 [Acipenser sinensis]